jgi:hypothetical protein
MSDGTILKLRVGVQSRALVYILYRSNQKLKTMKMKKNGSGRAERRRRE